MDVAHVCGHISGSWAGSDEARFTLTIAMAPARISAEDNFAICSCYSCNSCHVTSDTIDRVLTAHLRKRPSTLRCKGQLGDERHQLPRERWLRAAGQRRQVPRYRRHNLGATCTAGKQNGLLLSRDGRRKPL